jgi:hypothetical protein
MNNQQSLFRRENKREKIQTLVDMDIFRKETSEDNILDYLENPYDLICSKYDSCYEISWDDLRSRYET